MAPLVMPSGNPRTSNLTQDVALLDLISAAAEAPEVVRERAHELAQAHRLASPDQVDRALAAMLPVADPYAWDRPLTSADRDAQIDHAESEKRIVADAVARFPVDAFSGGLLSLILFAILFTATGISGHLNWWWFLGPGLTLGAIGLVSWGHSREKALDAIIAPGGRHRGSVADDRLYQLDACVPNPEQMAQWLSHPEVAAQARAWIASSCGLMAQDAWLLDARVQALQTAAQKAAQDDLAAQLGLPI